MEIIIKCATCLRTFFRITSRKPTGKAFCNRKCFGEYKSKVTTEQHIRQREAKLNKALTYAERLAKGYGVSVKEAKRMIERSKSIY